MSKRPNKLGRIEGEPKQKLWSKIPWKNVGVMAVALALVLAGNQATLKFQDAVANVKQSGVNQYIKDKCEPYADPKTGQKWLECDYAG